MTDADHLVTDTEFQAWKQARLEQLGRLLTESWRERGPARLLIRQEMLRIQANIREIEAQRESQNKGEVKR